MRKFFYYVKTRKNGVLGRGYCPPNHAIKATVIWEPNNYLPNFDGRSHARMIKFQKRYILENSEITI